MKCYLCTGEMRGNFFIIDNIGFYKGRPRIYVFLFPGCEVIKNYDFVAFCYQPVNDVRTDKSSTACYQCPHKNCVEVVKILICARWCWVYRSTPPVSPLLIPSTTRKSSKTTPCSLELFRVVEEINKRLTGGVDR